MSEGKSNTNIGAVTSGSAQLARSVIFCQEDVPTGEDGKARRVISERLQTSCLVDETNFNHTRMSDPVSMDGGEADEIGRGLKDKREEVERVTKEDDQNGGVGGQFSEFGSLRKTSRKREGNLDEAYDFFMSSLKKPREFKSSTDGGKQVRTQEAMVAHNLKVGNAAETPAATTAVKDNVERKASASADPLLPCENGRAGKRQVNVEEDVTVDLSAKKANVVDGSQYTFNMEDPALYDYPDAEFSNFGKDKEERCFSPRQIWAVYDTIDSMPRFYVEIKKVFSPGFKLLITWLDADPENQGEIEWVENGLPVACGKFKCSISEETSDRLMFSHKIHFERGRSRGHYGIYPRKGQTWALFKDWDIKWRPNPEIHRKYVFEIVEILSEHVHDAGIRVVYLEKVKGFVSLFQRVRKGKVGSISIPSSELLRFSHQIPSFRMSCTGREGVPIDSFELDPAALPIDLIKSPGVCPSFPDEVFGNFDRKKSRSKFQPGQIWAVYSDKDGMPNTYAQIKKVESTPFKLLAALLEPCTRRTKPVCCGIFEVQHRTTRMFPPSSFSHEMEVGSITKNIYAIYPRDGEIWAVYKNWNSELLNSGTESNEYEIVEILKNKDDCIEVSCLVPLTDFEFLFKVQRKQNSNTDSVEIRRGELARFSHQIPAIQCTGENYCWELDPKSVPSYVFVRETAG